MFTRDAWALWQAARSQPADQRAVSDDVRSILQEICDMQKKNYGQGTETHHALIGLCDRSRAALKAIDSAHKKPIAWVLIRQDGTMHFDECCVWVNAKDAEPEAECLNDNEDGDVWTITPVYASPQPVQPSVPINALEQAAKSWSEIEQGDGPLYAKLLRSLIAAHDGKGE
jgi:hypothetical protein